MLDRAVAADLPKEARILVIDIELRPGQAYWWQPKVQWIAPHMVIDKPAMICFDAKWFGSPNHIFRSEWEHGADDMIAEARRLLDEAHVVIGYNSQGFDVKHINREIEQANTHRPPSAFFDVDLIKTARQRFKFPYNSLNEVCRDLGLELKLEHTGFDLWLDVMAGCPKAQRLMQRYNRRDVEVTEALYARLRPWIKGHPNVNMFRTERISGCPTCGSDDVEANGFHYTQTRAYRRFVCNSCGTPHRATNCEPTMTQHRRAT